MDENPADHRRARRIAARREQILHAAAYLFANKGFHRTTTEDIARMAEVSEGTLYNYFANKDDLLIAIMAHLTDELLLNEHLHQELPHDVHTTLAALFELRKEFLDKNFLMLQSVLSEILVDPGLRKEYLNNILLPNITLFEKYLKLRIDQGDIRPIDPALVGRILAGVVMGLFVFQALGDPVVTSEWDALTETIVAIFINGLATHKGSNVPEEPLTP